jgi:subtilisin family serine protease
MQDRIGAQSLREIRSIRVHQIKLPSGWSVEQGVEFYRRNPNVEYAEPNYRRHAKATTPDDPSFSNLWGLNNTGQAVNGASGTADADMNAPEAWDFTTGSGTLVIAVIDTGVAYNHPDLAANIWTNPGDPTEDGVDNDATGYIADPVGCDCDEQDNDPNKSQEQGTQVGDARRGEQRRVERAEDRRQHQQRDERAAQRTEEDVG